MPTDALGAPVALDDLAVYATGGRAWNREVVQVVEIRKKVRVITINSIPPVKIDPWKIEDRLTKWIDSKSMYLVEKFKER